MDEALGFETSGSLGDDSFTVRSASHLAVEVSRVEPGSWAQRMRLRMGDHFVSIDGVPVGSYTGTSLRDAVQSRQRPMRLRFRRQGHQGLEEER